MKFYMHVKLLKIKFFTNYRPFHKPYDTSLIRQFIDHILSDLVTYDRIPLDEELSMIDEVSLADKVSYSFIMLWCSHSESPSENIKAQRGSDTGTMIFLNRKNIINNSL